MKVTYIANACVIYEQEGFKLLTDPWLVNGAFEGSWCHAPAIRTKPEDVANVDAIYISHIHPDHYDPETLKHFRKNIPIVILKGPGNFFQKSLEKLGFTNLIVLNDQEPYQLGPFRLTLFAPFDTHHMFHSTVGNLLDSSILLETENDRLLNINDNIPSLAAAEKLKKTYSDFTMIQMQYCSAGPFPSCFNQLDSKQKVLAGQEVTERYLSHFYNLAKIFKPKFLVPFAGEFVLGGSQSYKNQFLGTTTVDHAYEYVKTRDPAMQIIRFNEGLTFDTAKDEIINGKYESHDPKAQAEHIQNFLSKITYPYEKHSESLDEINVFLRQNLAQARERLWTWQQKLNFFSELNSYIKVGDEWFWFNWSSPESKFLQGSFQQPYLKCSMHPNLLKRILLKQSHWNNAEVGCHIDYERVPDIYSPDVHTLLSFLHL